MPARIEFGRPWVSWSVTDSGMGGGRVGGRSGRGRTTDAARRLAHPAYRVAILGQKGGTRPASSFVFPTLGSRPKTKPKGLTGS